MQKKQSKNNLVTSKKNYKRLLDYVHACNDMLKTREGIRGILEIQYCIAELRLQMHDDGMDVDPFDVSKLPERNL